MADKRISQLVDRGTVVNNDVVPIVVFGATTTNKATISSIQTFMQGNLDLGVTSVGITLGSSGTDVSVTGSPITTSGNITINIPDASATARGVVNTNAQTFAGAKTFNNSIIAGTDVQLVAAGSANPTILRNTSGTSSSTTGSNVIGFNGTNNIFVTTQSRGGFILGFNNSVSNREYTLPDASGTIALTSNLTGFVTLNTVQTITAQKTFTGGGSSDTMIISHGSGSGFALDAIKAGNGEVIRVNKTSGSGNAMTVIGGNFEAPTIVRTGGTSSQFLMADGSVNTSVLPSGAYLPLTGGTLTGALNGTTANFSGSTFVGGGISSNLGTLSLTFNSQNILYGPLSYGQVPVQATLGVGASGIVSQFPASTALTITSAGAVTLTGALNGTSASFTGALTANGQVTFYQPLTNTSSYLIVENNRSRNTAIRLKTTLGDYYVGTGIGADTNQFQIFDGNAGENRLTIASTGAATFSSSLTTGGTINSGDSITMGGELYFGGILSNRKVRAFSTGTEGNGLLNYAFWNGSSWPIVSTLSNTGAATFSSSVTATSAVFSGNVTSNNTIIANQSGADVAAIIATSGWSGGFNNRIITFGRLALAVAGEIGYDDPNTGLYIGTTTNHRFAIRTNNSDRLTIASTGAATFSSSVTATGSGTTSGLIINNASGSPQNYIDFTAGATLISRMSRGNGASGLETNGLNIDNFSGFKVRLNQLGGSGGSFTIDGGNVGIGTATPSFKLDIEGASTIARVSDPNTSGANRAGGFRAQTNTSTGDFLSIANNANAPFNSNDGVYIMNRTSGSNLHFTTNNGGTEAERMRITSGGQIRQTTSIADWSHVINNSSTSPNGILIDYTGAAPNNASNNFLFAADTSTLRFAVRANGGISNFQGNDTNLSDQRVKKDIEPLESYWDKFKAIEIVKFKYKDQTHDDFNIGVIAQQVEAVAPEFVDVDGWDTKPKLDEEGNEIVSEEEPLKSIYTADLHHATIKVLQEAMAKIEKLETEIDSLKNQIK